MSSIFCPYALNCSEKIQKYCKGVCTDFALYICLENPSLIDSLIDVFEKMMSHKEKANIIVDSVIDDDLMPMTKTEFEKVCDKNGYTLVINKSYTPPFYMTSMKMLINSYGGGLIIYGSQDFYERIRKDFDEYIFANYSKSDIQDIQNKIQTRYFSYEKIKPKFPRNKKKMNTNKEHISLI